MSYLCPLVPMVTQLDTFFGIKHFFFPQLETSFVSNLIISSSEHTDQRYLSITIFAA